MEQQVNNVTSTNVLDGLLDEWLCPDCPNRGILREEIQQGLKSSNPLMKNTGRFAMRYLEASICETDQLPSSCGNLAVQGALGFLLEAHQAVHQGDRASQTS